jgi:threonine aldolase
VGGVQTRSVPTNSDGTLSLEAIEGAIRGIDQHWPTTRAVLLENTHNFTGGKVLPMAYVRQVRALLDKHARGPIALHCDGARVWHAAIAQSVSVQEVLAPFDTASLCMSKGLGAPVGSVIVGTKALIEGKARRYAKMLGGGMRQSGVLAAACIYALDHQFERLREDHATAAELGEALRKVGTDVIEPEVAAACCERGIMIGAINPDTLRAIPHYGCGFDLARVVAVVTAVHKSLSA